jgi:hypothetical protein
MNINLTFNVFQLAGVLLVLYLTAPISFQIFKSVKLFRKTLPPVHKPQEEIWKQDYNAFKSHHTFQHFDVLRNNLHNQNLYRLIEKRIIDYYLAIDLIQEEANDMDG